MPGSLLLGYLVPFKICWLCRLDDNFERRGERSKELRRRVKTGVGGPPNMRRWACEVVLRIVGVVERFVFRDLVVGGSVAVDGVVQGQLQDER